MVPPLRSTSSFSTPSNPSTPDPLRPSFEIDSKSRSYKQQYANLYWLRLAVLRAKVEKRARGLWEGMEGVATPPKHVKRVLDVDMGNLCYIIGTVYVDMSLKPNILEDLARLHYLAAPPPRSKFYDETDKVMLEDESGRVKLVGERIKAGLGTFVTGTIMGVLGAETPEGNFEVVELCYAGLPPQPAVKSKVDSTSMVVDGEKEGEWVALVSGLEMSLGTDPRVTLLSEWLLGEIEDEDAQGVSRLILAGNSLQQPQVVEDDAKKSKRYGYDSSTYSAKPTESLDAFLADLLPSLPIDVLPGPSDPTGSTMPQQSLHPALLPMAAVFEGFAQRTNPFWCDVGEASFFGTSGQPLDDIFKYLESDDRVSMAQQTLEWSHIAPTCPDTLWCYPFSSNDPFILQSTPHVYFVGNQPKFETKLIGGPEGQRCRIVLLPKFCETGQVVMVNTSSLEVKLHSFVV